MAEPTVTIAALAAELQIHPDTIRREVRRRKGKLVFYKIDKSYQIYRWSVKDWIESKMRGGGRR